MTPATREEPLRADLIAGAPAHVDLLDLLLPLVRFKYVIAIGTLFGALCAMLAVFSLQPEYTGLAVIMPPQQGQSSGALISQVTGLASISALSGGALHDPNDLYIALLQSQSVRDGVIAQLKLERHYHAPELYYAELALWGSSKFLSERGGLISIAVKDHDPREAALIANTYVTELHKFTDLLTITEASRRAEFFARELGQQKTRLEETESALQQTERATGAIAPSNQTALVIQRIADLQAQISSREIQLNSMRLSYTDQNADVIQLGHELGMLRGQLRALESENTGHVPGDVLLTSQSAPQAQLTYNRKLRDVTYQTYLVDLIQRQYEAAKLDEAKAAPVIQLVDPARPPVKKSGPSRMLWTAVGGALAFVISCLTVWGLYLVQCVYADPLLSSRLEPFRRAFRAGL